MIDSTTEQAFLLLTINAARRPTPPAPVEPLASPFPDHVTAIQKTLTPLLREAGAVPTYLVAREALESRACLRVLRAIDGPHELGTYADHRASEAAGVDSGTSNADDRYRALEALTTAFQRGLGYAPRTFRSASPDAGTLVMLEKLGYWVNTSIAAGRYRNPPEQPYVPDRERPGRVGHASRRLLELPVSTSRGLFGRRRRLRPWDASPMRVKAIASRQLRRYREYPLIALNLAFDVWEFTPDVAPCVPTADDVERRCQRLLAALHWFRKEGFVFSCASDFALRYYRSATAPALAFA